MINNLKQIISLLSFDSEDDFYHLQILKRKKEHPDLGSNSYVVKTYYIKSIEHLERVFPEIKSICDFHNARAYINLNKRSFEKIAYHTLKKVTDCILNKDFKSVRKAYESVCGGYSSDKDKKWIIDVDQVNIAYSLAITEKIKQYEPNPGESKVITYIETKNGWHIITKPFNTSTFSRDCEIYSQVPEIQKNNPTILYIP
jgi:hypothetical protein